MSLSNHSRNPQRYHSKIFANCLISALLAVAALEAMSWLAFYMIGNGMDVSRILREKFGQENFPLAAFIYDVFRFLLFGSLAAGLMLLLKPRRVLLYATASVVLLAPLLQFMRFGSDFFSVALSIIWTLTIPLLYWLFVRIEKQGNGKTSISEQRSPGKEFG